MMVGNMLQKENPTTYTYTYTYARTPQHVQKKKHSTKM